MGMFLFLLSFPAAIAAWVWTAKKMKIAGKGGAARHFAGLGAGFAVWLVLVIIGVIVDPAKQNGEATKKAEPTTQVKDVPAPVETTPVAVVEEVETPTQEAAQKAEQAATLDLDWETFRKRVDDDFAAAGFRFGKIPSSIKPEGSEQSVRNVAMLPVTDNLIASIAEDPESKKLTSISATVGPHDDPAENLRNFSAAALILSAAGGDDGNLKVGGKIIEMTTNAINKFAKDSRQDKNATVKDSFVVDHVKYGIFISGNIPIMLFAEPESVAEQK